MTDYDKKLNDLLMSFDCEYGLPHEMHEMIGQILNESESSEVAFQKLSHAIGYIEQETDLQFEDNEVTTMFVHMANLQCTDTKNTKLH